MRVLVVDDEKRISGFLREALEAEYFAVDISEDGEDGAYQAGVNDYDLVILDNILPKKMGIDVCREIRARGKAMPILILSVRNETSKKIDFFNAGADDYLTKPFSLEEMMARVRALLRRPSHMQKEVLSVGDLELDTRTSIVRKSGKEVHLTRKEFMLLRYLMKNQGVVVSRGMIMEHVWDMTVDIFSNTIESHIVSLRRKIKDRNEERIIKTISGRGYTIETSESEEA